jgi:hypothetical protein
LIIFVSQLAGMRSTFLKWCFLLVAGAGLTPLPAQHTDLLNKLQSPGGEGQVKITADSLLVDNYYKLLAQNRKISGVPGYRIRIFSESGIGAKEEQQKIRARFLSLFPGVDAYYRYDEPYFKVYVGDCRTKSEALLLYDRVEKKFANPILVEDYINIK